MAKTRITWVRWASRWCGIQRHVMACVKHFAANSIENVRFKVDVRIDERALREVYLPHFKRCVDAGAACVMSAYNRLNGEHCGHNRRLLREILKDEWGFEGFVMSDFLLGIRDARSAILAGLDQEMPIRWRFRQLRRLVDSGAVPTPVIDEAVVRIVRQQLRFASAATADLPVPAVRRIARWRVRWRRRPSIEYGLFHGYQLLDRNRDEPAFPFGFGLSYTTFAYAGLDITTDGLGPDDVVRLRVGVTNTGTRFGEEVVQCYVGYPESQVERPVKALKVFRRVRLAPGETQQVELEIPVSSLAYWESSQSRWIVEPVTHDIFVGGSSHDRDLLRAGYRISGPAADRGSTRKES
jgi:hypothetical protein